MSCVDEVTPETSLLMLIPRWVVVPGWKSDRFGVADQERGPRVLTCPLWERWGMSSGKLEECLEGGLEWGAWVLMEAWERWGKMRIQMSVLGSDDQ